MGRAGTRATGKKPTAEIFSDNLAADNYNKYNSITRKHQAFHCGPEGSITPT